MSKVILKAGDKVELFNGTIGNVIELDWPMIKLGGESIMAMRYHLMDIVEINGVNVELCDIIFSNDCSLASVTQAFLDDINSIDCRDEQKDSMTCELQSLLSKVKQKDGSLSIGVLNALRSYVK